MNTDAEKTQKTQQSETSLSTVEKRIMRRERESYEYLREEALSALGDFKRCVNNFDFICDEKLVDVCIYDIQKAMSRYEYLVSELKRINRN